MLCYSSHNRVFYREKLKLGNIKFHQFGNSPLNLETVFILSCDLFCNTNFFQRPWAQYDSNYQIMFKVGMGQSPDPPDNMIDEGLDFLEMCFKHDQKERASAKELLYHNFVKAGEDLN